MSKNINPILLAMFCVVASPSSALPILNAGETFTYEFATLPYLRPGTVQAYRPTDWTPPASIVELFWEALPLDPGAQLRVKVFEDLLNDTPLADYTWTGTLSGGFMFGLGENGLTDVWKDLQGAFSMTALSGSVYVPSIDLLTQLRTSDWVDLHIHDKQVRPALDVWPPYRGAGSRARAAASCCYFRRDSLVRDFPAQKCHGVNSSLLCSQVDTVDLNAIRQVFGTSESSRYFSCHRALRVLLDHFTPSRRRCGACSQTIPRPSPVSAQECGARLGGGQRRRSS